MTTLAEHIIVAGAENHPPMLEKSMYDSWVSRIRLFIKGKKNGRMMLQSIDNGPLVYPTIEENRQTRPKRYSELTEAQPLRDDSKDILDKGKLLMKATELSYQERECRLYNLFDKFAYDQGETLYEYYWRFSQLINDMHTIGMTMQQVQVNTKFLNALPPEWSKFVTDVKLANSNHSRWKSHSSTSSRKTNSEFAGTRNRGIATTSRGNYAAGQAKIVKCYNYLGEWHMAKQCTQPKRPRSSARFKEKLICDPDVLSEVPYFDSYQNDMINQDVQEMLYSEQTHIDDYPDNDINNDSNIITYS
ncbi:hypothetical protein Tco_0566241 [Tanacetum coccineum]